MLANLCAGADHQQVNPTDSRLFVSASQPHNHRCRANDVHSTHVSARDNVTIFESSKTQLASHLQRLLLEEPAVCKHVLDRTLAVQHVQRCSFVLLLSLHPAAAAATSAGRGDHEANIND
jgi:hypothetical protein